MTDFCQIKAIDLIDEASSRARIKTYTEPENLKELQTKIEEIEKDKEEAVRSQNLKRQQV